MIDYFLKILMSSLNINVRMFIHVHVGGQTDRHMDYVSFVHILVHCILYSNGGQGYQNTATRCLKFHVSRKQKTSATPPAKRK